MNGSASELRAALAVAAPLSRLPSYIANSRVILWGDPGLPNPPVHPKITFDADRFVARVLDNRWVAARSSDPTTDPRVRRAFIALVNGVNQPAVEEALTRMILHDPEGQVREAAISELASRDPTPTRIATILSLRQEPDPRIGIRAAGALAQWGDPRASDWLPGLLYDRSNGLTYGDRLGVLSDASRDQPYLLDYYFDFRNALEREQPDPQELASEALRLKAALADPAKK
jgi:hypothetical protein